MITDFFIPPGADEVSYAHLRDLPVNAIAVACRDNRFRRLVRWVGIARCQGGEGAFTCRISGRPGIFGLSWEGGGGLDAVRIGRFGIHYFPDQEEDVCDLLRIDAAVAVQRADYAQGVRDFVADETLRSLFRIGTLQISCPLSTSELGLHLCAERHRRMISDCGVGSLETGWIIPPGALEEDLPAYALCRMLFDVVAAAVSACTKQAPSLFLRTERGGSLLHRQADGTMVRDASTEDSVETQLVADDLVWGEAHALVAALYHEACHDSSEWDMSLSVEQELAKAAIVARAEYDAGSCAALDLPDGWASAPCWQTHDLDSPACARLYPSLADKRPGLIVVSGFLGAGKTTFLNNCIEYHRARERFVAVIQNEVGATGVDEHLLGDSASVLALDEGCVCCTLAGSLAAGVRELTAQFSPEVILLETTGLANPLNLLAELGSIRDLVRLDTVVTVVDAANVQAVLESSAIARDQVRGADVVVCNKCDTISSASMETVKAALTALNPKAMMHVTTQGQIHPALFMDLETGKSCAGLLPAVPRSYANHTEEGYSSVRFFMPRPVTLEALEQAVGACPGAPFRIKGIVALDDGEPQSSGYVLAQCVAGRADFEPLQGFEGSPFLVMIGRGLDHAALLEHWQALGATLTESDIRNGVE